MQKMYQLKDKPTIKWNGTEEEKRKMKKERS